MLVKVRWLAARSWDDPIVDESRVLYVVAHPQANRPVYIGKADGCTVYERAFARDKHALWDWLANRGIHEHECLVGFPATDFVLTRQLLADVESLLIYNLQPHWNRQSTRTRGISRPGMVLFCYDEWRWRRSFRDTRAPGLPL